MQLRPEVQRFAEAMETQLRANDHKPGWQQDDPLDLCDRIQQELDELIQAIEGNKDGAPPDSEVMREAADVGNFALMVWDIVWRHSLLSRRPPGPTNPPRPEHDREWA